MHWNRKGDRKMSITSEAQVHFEFYRYIQNALDLGFSYRGVKFTKARPEYSKGLTGFADIVVFDNIDRPWLVIEAKKRVAGRYIRNIDPFSSVVIRQAHRYASQLGSPYFATYNGAVLVLFETEERFVPLLQRKTKSYLVKDAENFASELLREVIDLEKGIARWDPREDAFVSRLEEFHRRLFTYFGTKIEKKLAEDQKFLDTFTSWVRTQGWEPSTRILNNFSRQAAYLLMNKLIFYKVLQTDAVYSAAIPPLDFKPLELSTKLRENFDTLMENVDFEAVFDQDPIFDEIPLDATLSDELADFIQELDEYDLSKFGSDVIGRIYQRIIPPKERHDLGQYYTPPEVCELIVRLTVKDPKGHILDPAVGSGGFLVKAYEQLKTLKSEANLPANHKETIEQIHGIDINRFPAHLSAINLALRDLSSKTENLDIEISDFFNVKVGQQRIMVEKSVVGGKKIVEMAAPSKVDVIVANPPYIRQEKISDKNRVREHLRDLRLQKMSERSDIYCYFFTHSSEFLRERGDLGFITSNRWLTVGYGRDLQNFFLNNFKIKCVIAFDKQVFKDPLIGTVITILEKCPDETERNSNVVRFLRFKGRIELKEVIDKVETDYLRDLFYEDPKFRLVTRSQGDLYDEDKWYKYLYAPTLYFEIYSHEKIVQMKELATISSGIKTGANNFFYFRGQSFKDFGLDSFVSPIIKHVRQTEFIELKKTDTDWFVLDVHDIVDKILSAQEESMRETSDPAEVVKRGLGDGGFQTLLRYIERGEAQGVNRVRSVRSRRIWFDLGELPKPLILFPEVYWKKAQTLYNKEGLTLDKRLYSIWPKENIDPEVLLGILNSDLLLLMREIDGRVEEGQAMNRNSIMIYEANDLSILDPRRLSEEESDRIRKAFIKLLEMERKCDENTLKTLRRELNKAVLAPIDMENRAEELEKTIQALLEARIKGGGMHAEVIIGVKEPEYKKIMKLKGATPREERGRITLEEFFA